MLLLQQDIKEQYVNIDYVSICSASHGSSDSGKKH